MKRIAIYLFAFFYLILQACQPEKDSKCMESFFTYSWGGVGNIKNDWSQANPLSFENPAESDNLVTVRSLWDTDSLYFLLTVADKDLRAYQIEKDHRLLYLDDMVEILIDAHNDKNDCWNTDDIVYHINLLGQKKDDRGTKDCESDTAWDGEASYSVRLFGTVNDTTDIDKGYHVEIAFPWSELGVRPEEGRAIGINFANGDNDGNGRQLFDWAGAWPLRTPSAFGTLYLKK